MMNVQETAEDSPARRLLTRAGADGELALVACGPDRPRFVALASDRPVVIGRHDSCQLSLHSPLLSRFHARFARCGSSVTVEDLGSRHGTWLDGARVSRAELTPGSAVRLADVVIALCQLDPTPTQAAPMLSASEALYLSPRAREVHALLQRVARSDVSVLLLGETGTGKELAAREIHAASGRSGALRVLHCGAIPAQLVEGSLFGHERGAFTGADRARASLFEEADGGTLLLDEVGELSLAAQAALLRVIETRRVTRVGSSREIPFDVRIVSATHRDLTAMTARGEFRLDLLHRLCVVSVELPPLRERRSEIAALTRHFLRIQGGPQDIEDEALARLQAYHWPGNIRELRNVLMRAGALAQGASISVRDLPQAMCKEVPAVDAARVGLAQAGSDSPAAPTSSTPGALRDYLKALETEELQRALLACDGNQRRAAARLGIPLRTFERRLQAARARSARAVASES